MRDKETIVAPATGGGESALALLRVSGPLVPELVKDIFGTTPPSRQCTLGSYRSLNGEILDSLLYVQFEEGASYTGEATLELMPHGNPWLVRKLIDDLIQRGCQTAEAGAFTRQAFENGRLDLTQAEAVMQVIRARSDRALEAARRQLQGSLGNSIQALLDQLLSATSQVEASIDFPEEDLPDNPTAPTLAILNEIVRQLDYLIETRPYADLLHDGIKCVILGEPNVGKSSLLNALTGEQRVLVSDLPGTTRDYVEERLQIGPFLLRIIDTAGLHETADQLEQQGIHRSIQQIQVADLLLVVLDRTKPAPTLPDSVQSLLHKQNALVIENKADLEASASFDTFLPDCPHLRVSALEKSGLHELRKTLQEQITEGLHVPDGDRVLVSARHAAALTDATSELQTAIRTLQTNEPPELVAAHLRGALHHLEQVIGKVDNERMLDKLFGEFCIGK